MRMRLIIGLVVVGGLIMSSPLTTQAIFLPFAGRVVTPMMPPVVCTGGYGPITIVPAGFAPPSFYGTTPATIRYMYYVPKPGDVIIGLYNPIPNPFICGIPTPTGLPIPFPTFPIIFFGTSLIGI